MPPSQLFAAAAAALFTFHCHALAGGDRLPHASSRKAQQATAGSRILANPHYRAIFCGDEGTETSAEYARALILDLRHLEAAGYGTADALAHLKRRACPRQ